MRNRRLLCRSRRHCHRWSSAGQGGGGPRLRASSMCSRATIANCAPSHDESGMSTKKALPGEDPAKLGVTEPTAIINYSRYGQTNAALTLRCHWQNGRMSEEHFKHNVRIRKPDGPPSLLESRSHADVRVCCTGNGDWIGLRLSDLQPDRFGDRGVHLRPLRPAR